MPSINIADLANAKADVDHIAQLALSTAATAVDRLGTTKSTVKGAIDTLKAFNSLGAWVAFTAYAVKDLVTSGGTWYVCVTAHTASSAFATDSATKWRVHQGLTAQSLAESEYARGSVNLANYATLKEAITALPANGGVVDIPVGRFPAGVWKFDTNYMSKPNITLRGVQMPTFSANCDRLQGGSVIEGRFNVFADNFTVENLGFDCGKYVVDTYYGGLDTHTANHPNGDTWDGFAFAQPNGGAPLRAAQNFKAKNVIGLNRDSGSYGHAVLMEGFDGGSVDNVIGMYGIHALVIKARNVNVGIIAGYAASTNHVILKSDTYAAGGNINIDTVTTATSPPGFTPWSTPAVCSYGLYINPATASMGSVKISKARLSGATCPLKASGPSDKYLDNLMISDLEIEGAGMVNAIGMSFSGVTFYRIKFGRVTINNVADGVAYTQTSGFGADPMVFDSLSFANVSLRAIQAMSYGRVVITHLRTTNTINSLYSIDDTARVYVGREELSGAPTTKWYKNPPALQPGWQAWGSGNSSLRIFLGDFGVKATGLLKPVAGATPAVLYLPPYLRAAEATRRLAYGWAASGTHNAVLVNISPSETMLFINNNANITGADQALSLDGVNWMLD